MGKKFCVNDMDTKQISRWLALFESVNLISDECMERNIDFNKLNLKINPIKDFIRCNLELIESDITNKTKRVKVEF